MKQFKRQPEKIVDGITSRTRKLKKPKLLDSESEIS